MKNIRKLWKYTYIKYLDKDDAFHFCLLFKFTLTDLISKSIYKNWAICPFLFFANQKRQIKQFYREKIAFLILIF